MTAATLTYATIELSGAVFSVRSVRRLYNEEQLLFRIGYGAGQGEARHRKYKRLNLAMVKLTTFQVTKMLL
jgi:hypothetical protein